MRIFGCINFEPPEPGTFKAEVFRVIEQFEQGGTVPEEVVESLAQSVINLRRKHKGDKKQGDKKGTLPFIQDFFLEPGVARGARLTNPTSLNPLI